ncbi:unnamed protein product [Owenia fusiformis]|nr:unnamed protein product [Owenia fusiformis]
MPQGQLQYACKIIIETLGPVVIDMLEKHETPDVICHALHLCTVDEGQPQCHLFPVPKDVSIQDRAMKYSNYGTSGLAWKHRRKEPFSVCKLPGIKILCDWIERIFDDHNPALDIDGDNFSTFQTLRGSSWRGKDCNDEQENIHPGAKPELGDVFHDTNCNGIYGVDGNTGLPYEDLYCKDSQPIGVAAIGDSVTAHFHIPPEWLEAEKLNVEMLRYLPFWLENELDWPHLSGTTGFMNDTTGRIEGSTDSIYLQMRKRNRCNHRDYQNLGVNGGRSGSTLNNENALARDKLKDNPLLVFYALVGNDVCNGHSDTLAHMTSPEEMRKNFLKTLKFLDAKVPNGSHLIVIGLADGSLLYDNLKNRVHPLGKLWGNVKYPQFYDWFNCLQVTPCAGWMNSNATIRNGTTKRARELSQVLKSVVAETKGKLRNFDASYLDCPIGPVLDAWKAQGGEGWQLIEPVDGFHINQIAHKLTAEYTWNYLEKNLPHFIGNINPHNAEIIKKFGEQGGHL